MEPEKDNRFGKLTLSVVTTESHIKLWMDQDHGDLSNQMRHIDFTLLLIARTRLPIAISCFESLYECNDCTQQTARGSVVAWGPMLQARSSQVRFQNWFFSKFQF
jgi:hypothetical protein